MAQETTDATFEQEVLNSEQPVLVDFWAPWCGPCRMVGPVIEDVSSKTAGKAKVYKMNVDENPATAYKYGISSIPTVMVFKNGEIASQMVGVQPEENYLNALAA